MADKGDQPEEGEEDEEEELYSEEEDSEEEGEEEDEDLDAEAGMQAMDDAAQAGMAAAMKIANMKKFRCNIKSIRISNLERRKRDVSVQFAVGDTPMAMNEDESDDEEGEGKKKRKRKSRAKKFKTEVIEKLEKGKIGTFTKKFETYWVGNYEDLEVMTLSISLLERNKFGGTTVLDTQEIKLLHIAAGSIQQEVTFVEKDGRRQSDSYKCFFHIYFQEQFCYQLKMVDWKAFNLIAGDATGTSDPFIVFSIKANKKFWYRKGGYFGRSCKTEVAYNTLFPVYSGAKRPLYYYGTRSELENEILKVTVYDWDLTDSSDVIGFAEVPLRGLVEQGHVASALAMWEDPKDKKDGKLMPAGRVEGIIECLNLPEHRQFGDIVNLLPNVTYLAVHIFKCNNLRAADEGGTSDPYCSAEWDQAQQETRVIQKNINPVFDEILYFPVKLVRITQEDMEKKGSITIRVLDYDPSGRDILGFCSIGLDKITNAPYRRVGEIKSRFYDATLGLQRPGERIPTQSISVRCYFQPDLPSDVIIAPRRDAPTELPPDYVARELTWRQKIPRRLAARGKHLISVTDEQNANRFLPTFMLKMAPPRDITDPMQVARMVNCIYFESDADALGGAEFTGEMSTNIWSSPNFFMDMKKGAYEDHAILMANLFLGMGLDAYICLGKTNMSKDHVWVVTREPNGSVKFWETTKGFSYLLPGRWTGLFMEDSADIGTEAAGGQAQSSAEVKPKKKKKDPDADKVGGAKKGRAAELARKQAEEREKARQKQDQAERAMLYCDTEMTWDEPEPVNEFETPREDSDQFDAGGMLQKGVATIQKMRKASLAVRDAAGHEDEADTVVEGAEQSGQGEDETSHHEEEEEDELGETMPEEVKLPQCEELPYETIEVLVNNENLWANIQGYHITTIQFNMDDTERWLPFIDPAGGFNPNPPKPFYEPRRVGPKLPGARLKALRDAVYKEVKMAYKVWRSTRNLKCRWLTRLEPVLEEGLELMELAHCSSNVVAKRNVDKWKARLMTSVPAECHFVGRPITFTVTDPEMIKTHIMKEYDYHECAHKKVQFAIAVGCFAHYCSVNSMWVYVAVITPNKMDEEKDAKK